VLIKKKIAALGATALLAVTMLSGCGRSIDKEAVGAVPVPGARALFRFCDGPTLVYVTIWDGADDEYEAMWPGWCTKGPDGKWFYDTTTAPTTPAKSDGNVEDGDK